MTAPIRKWAGSCAIVIQTLRPLENQIKESLEILPNNTYTSLTVMLRQAA